MILEGKDLWDSRIGKIGNWGWKIRVEIISAEICAKIASFFKQGLKLDWDVIAMVGIFGPFGLIQRIAYEGAFCLSFRWRTPQTLPFRGLHARKAFCICQAAKLFFVNCCILSAHYTSLHIASRVIFITFVFPPLTLSAIHTHSSV